MKRSKRRGVTFGTIAMLCITATVLIGFAALLPTLTGTQDIHLEAAELFVAIDESFSHLDIRVDLTQQAIQPFSSVSPPSFAGQSAATQQPVFTSAPKQAFTLCATGSIILNTTMQKALTVDDTLRFDILTDQISGAMTADLSIATLEHTIIPTENPSNTNMPIQLLTAIRSTGINALYIGHSDALNSGMAGVSATKQAISDAGLLPYGLCTSENESRITLLNLKGVQVALLSYQEHLSSTGRKKTSSEERAFAYAEPSPERIIADIADAKAAGAQVIIVSICWGKAGANIPTDEQIQLAQKLANAGADIILGTHSGALQPVTVLTADRGDGKYHPVLCAYSLGNLVTHDRERRANLASILLKATVVYDPSTDCVAFDGLSYTPTYAWRGKEDGKTRYRILLNTGDMQPDFVDKDQHGVMERCYTLVTEIMADTGIPLFQ